MKLLVPIFLNCFFVIAFYLLDKKTKFRNLKFTSKQIMKEAGVNVPDARYCSQCA